MSRRMLAPVMSCSYRVLISLVDSVTIDFSFAFLTINTIEKNNTPTRDESFFENI